jgi:hypothetical protein
MAYTCAQLRPTRNSSPSTTRWPVPRILSALDTGIRSPRRLLRAVVATAARPQALNHSAGVRAREAADDLAGVRLPVWQGFGASHYAGPVPGLDRVAFTGKLRQFDLLDVFPVRPLDRDGEPVHSAHNRTTDADPRAAEACAASSNGELGRLAGGRWRATIVYQHFGREQGPIYLARTFADLHKPEQATNGEIDKRPEQV